MSHGHRGHFGVRLGVAPRDTFTGVGVGRKTGSEAGEAIRWGHFFLRCPGYLWWALRLGRSGVWWSQRTAPQPVTSFELNGGNAERPAYSQRKECRASHNIASDNQSFSRAFATADLPTIAV
jgi:hypothetical protein